MAISTTISRASISNLTFAPAYVAPPPPPPRFQSLLYRAGSTYKQIKMLDGELVNSFAAPNSSGGVGPHSLSGYPRINPVTQSHFIASYYGASASANYPVQYGTFSYNGGFGGASLYYFQYARSLDVKWSPDGKGIITTGDIYHAALKFNTSTGIPSGAYNLGSDGIFAAGAFSNNSDAIVLMSDQYSTGILQSWPWSSSTGLGGQLPPPATNPNKSYLGTPLWMNNDNNVVVGNIGYTWNNGLVTPTHNAFTELGYYIQPQVKINENTFIAKNVTSTYIETISYNETSGFSKIDYAPIAPPNDVIYDPYYKYMYYRINTTIYKRSITNGAFGSEMTVATNVSADTTLSEIFSHTLM